MEELHSEVLPTQPERLPCRKRKLQRPLGKHEGQNSEGETLPAEIVDGLFHKKGALAAARMGDQVNPEKRSSGS